MGYVKARSNFHCRVNGRRVLVTRGDDPRREDDPVVMAHPGMFRPAFDEVDKVEDASAAPGARRSLGRPKGMTRSKPGSGAASRPTADDPTTSD